MSEATLSEYKFRFGTHGCYNPLYTTVNTERPVESTSYALSDAFVSSTGTPELTRMNTWSVSSGSWATLPTSMSNSVTCTTTSNKKTRSVKYGYSGLRTDITSISNLTSLVFKYNIKFTASSAANTNTKEGYGLIIVGYTDADGYSHSKSSSATSWSFGKTTVTPSAVRVDDEVSIELDTDFISNNTINSITLQFSVNEAGTLVISELEAVTSAGGDTISSDEQVLDDSGKFIILCPWELKHVTALTVSVSGQTSTMGIPNKPASRTQIFDTGGPVRTFKITGKRYDFEENVSNWDFINTQFNNAKDSEYGNSENSDDTFTYVGISWLFSNLQVILKGYTFNIRNADPRDKRFIHGANPSKEFANEGESLPDADDIFEGTVFYVKGVGFYKCTDGVWKPFELKEDTGYNVAITGFNASFSESEPGLLDYTITCVERMEYGNKLYNAYADSKGRYNVE